jgi:hypothetical protein
MQRFFYYQLLHSGKWLALKITIYQQLRIMIGKNFSFLKNILTFQQPVLDTLFGLKITLSVN